MSLFSSVLKFAGPVVSGLLGSRSADKAVGAQQAATQESARQFNIVREDTAPYREAGQTALAQVLSMLTDPNADYSMLEKIPGYEFGKDQGLEALNNMQAAKGITGGRRAKELTRYASDYASTKFQDYLRNLLGLSNYGVGGIAQSAGAGQNYVNSLQTGAMNLGKIYGDQAKTLNNSIQGGIQNYLLDKNRSSGTGYSGVY